MEMWFDRLILAASLGLSVSFLSMDELAYLIAFYYGETEHLGSVRWRLHRLKIAGSPATSSGKDVSMDNTDLARRVRQVG